MADENTPKLTVVTQAVFDTIFAEKVALGAEDIWYGEQRKIPRTPCIAIESGLVNREMAGVSAQGRTLNTFTVYIMIFISKLQDEQISRKEADELAEAVEAVLHVDANLGGVVLYGFVTSIEPGYITRQSTTFRVARITWQGVTKTMIGA
jgi:hypothetical protein